MNFRDSTRRPGREAHDANAAVTSDASEIGASVLGSLEGLLRAAARAGANDVLRNALPAVVAEMRAILEEERRNYLGSKYVTVKIAAEIMHAHPATVRRLIAAGKLGRASVESQPRVTLSDIHAYMTREGNVSPTIDLDERARAILRNE